MRPAARAVIVWLLLAVVGVGPGPSIAAADDRSSVGNGAPPEEDPRMAAAKLAVRQRDFRAAARLWREAAKAGSAEAAFRLGVAHRNGLGVERDLSAALAWLTRAAEGGDPDGRYELGMIYRNGLGVDADRDRAIDLFERAAHSGHRKAKEALDELGRSRSLAYQSADARVLANQRDPREALAQSIRTRDTGSAKEALARGAPIDGAPGDQKHWRPLILAIDVGDAEMVALLLAHGADPRIRSRDGEAALVLAIREGDRSIVRALLSAGADPDVRAVSGYTALMVAAQEGRSAIVRDLLRARADPRVALEDGTSAASVARRFGHAEVARLLAPRGGRPEDPAAAARVAALKERGLEAGAGGSSGSMPPMVEAARRGDADLVAEMVALGVDPTQRDAEGAHALTRAAAGGHAEVARRLLEAGVPVDAPGSRGATALMRAMESDAAGSDAVFELLLAGGADVHARDARGRAVIDYAATGATPAKLSALERAGGSWTPASLGLALEGAAADDRLAVVLALLPYAEAREARVGALCRAIEQRHEGLVDRLLAEGIAPVGDCGQGASPLSLVAGRGDLVRMKSLLDAGAPPEGGLEGADTPLIAAAGQGHVEAARLLLERGADVDRRGAHRMTALMAAAARADSKLVALLLEAGADRRMRSDTDHTAVDFARQAAAADTVRLIESHRPGWLTWLAGEGDDD